MRDFLSVFTDSAKEFTKVRSLVTTSLLVAVSMVIEMFSIDIGFCQAELRVPRYRYYRHAVRSVHGNDGRFCLRHRGLSGTPQRRLPAGICAGRRLTGLFYGLFLYQKWSGHSIQFVSNKTGKTTDITLYLRAIVARLADVIIINLLIQTKLNLHYGFIPQEAYGAAIVARVAKNVIELAIDLPLLFILLPVALKAYQHIFRRSVSPKVAG